MGRWRKSSDNVTVQDRGWQSRSGAVTPAGPLLRHGHPPASMKHVPGCQGPSLAWIKSGPRTNASGMNGFLVDQGSLEAPGLGWELGGYEKQ